jgi:hypothetical protein
VATERSIRDLPGEILAREQALQVIDRWRSQGFDIVVCHPSGYCSPANSHVLRSNLPAEYAALPLDSEEALSCLTTSIGDGASYRH